MIDTTPILAALPAALPFANLLGLRASRESKHDRARVFCPWHSERHPSCDVTTKDGTIVAVCRACGAGGDAFALAAAAWGLDARRDFLEVARRLAEALGVRLEEGRVVGPARPDPIAAIASRIDALADQHIAGRLKVTDADEAAIGGATQTDLRAALARLRMQDEAEREQDRRRDAQLGEMAGDALAAIAERERAAMRKCAA